MDGLVDRHQSLETLASGVLVVDDDAALRRELTSALDAAGFRTIAVADAEAALSAIAVTPNIAVVLADIRMPGRSGIALTKDLQVSQSGQHTVEVVLMSGYAGYDEAIGAMRAGAFDLVRKPFRLADIADVLSRATARAHARLRAVHAAAQARFEREVLFLAAPVGLGRIGRDLRLRGANPALAEILGVAEDTSIAELWATAPKLRECLEPTLARILANEDGQRATSLRVELPPRSGGMAANARVVDLRLYPVLEGGQSSRVDAIGLACVDVTTETALLCELDHRVRNAFAMFLGLVHGATRHAPDRDAAGVAAELTGRVMTLSRAYDLVRPAVGGLPGIAAKGTTVRTLVAAVLKPFIVDGDDARITLLGPDAALGPRTVPGLALVLHELAANALKHGALSTPAGRVELVWSAAEDTLMLEWREAGGPHVAGPPARFGFGLRLLGQPNLGGARLRTSIEWSCPAGLQARICVSFASA